MRVSVCIPHFNQHDYLERAVETALGQVCDGIELEVVISDNASADCCSRVLAYCKAMDDRVRVIRNRHNIGMVANWNRVVRESTGEIVCLLSADDELMPGAVESVCREFASDPSVVLVYGGNRVVVNEETQRRLGRRFSIPLERNYQRQVFPAPSFLKTNLETPQIQLCSAFFRREAYDLVGGFKGEAGPVADWVFWGELGIVGTVVRSDSVLGLYRVHDRSETINAMSSFSWILYHYLGEQYLVRKLQEVDRDAARDLRAPYHGCQSAMSAVKYCLQSPSRRIAFRQAQLIYSLWPSIGTFTFGCGVGLLSILPVGAIPLARSLVRGIREAKRLGGCIKERVI